jgi:hypothetical protein
MVDDLVQTGNTLLECARVLKEAGALEVSAYVTHAVFPNESWRKFATASSAIAPPGASSVAAVFASIVPVLTPPKVYFSASQHDETFAHSNRFLKSPAAATQPGGSEQPEEPSCDAGVSVLERAPSSSSPFHLKHFWITNSHPVTAALLKDVAPFKVLSIAPVLEDLLGL